MLDDGETLIDSGAIVDILDEAYGGERPTVRRGPERRTVLRLGGDDDRAPATRACRPPTIAITRRPRSCTSPGSTTARRRGACPRRLDAMVDPAAPYLLLGRLTQADITAFVAERLARFGLN